MKKDVAHDLTWSSALFSSEVWPLIMRDCGGGYIVPVESTSETSLAGLLDMHAGIDWVHCGEHGVRGIASRVQAGPDYSTFTVRASRDSGATTELEKRRLAIDTQMWLYPALTVQAYAETQTGPVTSVGVVKTVDLYRFIEGGGYLMNRTTNATFIICDWSKMQDSGVDVRVRKPKV